MRYGRNSNRPTMLADFDQHQKAPPNATKTTHIKFYFSHWLFSCNVDGRKDGHKHDEVNMTKMICALFWSITHHKVAIPYRRFGTTYWSHLKRPRNLSFLGLLDHHLLCNAPEEYRSYLNRGRNPKSRLICPITQILVANSPKKSMHNFSRYSWRQRKHWQTLKYRHIRGWFISVF